MLEPTCGCTSFIELFFYKPLHANEASNLSLTGLFSLKTHSIMSTQEAEFGIKCLWPLLKIHKHNDGPAYCSEPKVPTSAEGKCVNECRLSAGNSFHVTSKFLIEECVCVWKWQNAFMLLSPPRNRILIFNGCWTFVQMPRKCSCTICWRMQNIVWLWEVIYVVSPIRPSPLPQIEFEWCEHGKYQKGFSHLSKDGDNKNSYFAHTNNIMRFSSSEMWAEQLHEFFIDIQCGTTGCASDIVLRFSLVLSSEIMSSASIELTEGRSFLEIGFVDRVLNSFETENIIFTLFQNFFWRSKAS